jgi:GtrA-like protein.
MDKLFQNIGIILQHIIDFFYPPFRKIFPIQLFRYGVTGGSNLLFDWVLYFLVFHYILKKEMLYLGFVTLSSHVATLCIVTPITLASGFLLQRYVTFSTSKLRGRVQIVRYLEVFIMNFLLNLGGIKLLVDVFNIYPTPSKMIVSVFAVILTFLIQKNYSFKTQNVKS